MKRIVVLFSLWGRVIIGYIDGAIFLFSLENMQKKDLTTLAAYTRDMMIYDVENFSIPHAIISDPWLTSVELYR